MNSDSAATPLTPERWQRVEFVFSEVLDAPESRRPEILREFCEGDDALLSQVQNLLAAFEEEKHFTRPAEPAEPRGRLGETVGGYTLVAELGQGGMGTVYLAHRSDGEFEQQVALKVVSSHLRTQFFNERFRAERQILAGLNHPNITRLLDGGVSSAGDPYLVMEYVDGQAINRYCDERLLPISDRIRLFLHACSAVECAHRNLVVHRDLKPGNLLVTTEGVPKLLDFGTAKLLLAVPAESTSTRFHAMTLRYASPEQLRGETVSTSMDVYALGVMLYELLVGAWPFGDPDSAIAGLERAVRHVDPAPPRTLLTEEAARLRSTSRTKLAGILEGDLRSVVSKALDDDPRRRYTSVEQLSADLSRYLAGKPVLAREQTMLYRGARFVQRHRWQLALGAGLSAVLIFSTLTALQEYGRGQRRLVQVRNLSQSYLTDILNEVGKLPGSMKARLLIVDRARRNLDQLLPEAPHDPELRRALAAAYLQLGDIQGRPFSVSLGDAAGAMDSYRKAEAMAAKADPGDWEMLAELVRARRLIAQIEARAERTAEAIALLRSALEPARRLWKDAPSDLQVNGKPAAALYVETNLTLGYTMMKATDTTINAAGMQQALEQLQRTVHIAEEVQAAHPGMEDLAGLVSQYVGFAFEGMATATGNPEYFKEGAIAHRRSSDSSCKAFAKDPTPQTQRNCSDALGELSWILQRAGEGEAAVQAASQALAIMGPVTRAEPDSVESQQDLATAYMHLGTAEVTAGRFEDAIGHLHTAESLTRSLLHSPGNDPLEAGGLYVDIERSLGRALLGIRDRRGAIEALGRAIETAEVTPKAAWTLPSMRSELLKARSTSAQSIPAR